MAAIPVALCFLLSTYAVVALGRADGPYSFYLHQCRDHNRCMPGELFSHLRERLHARDVMQPVGNYLSDRWIASIKPPCLLQEAVATIKRYATGGSKVTVLLGHPIVNELALLYVDRWQHWPISFVFTDQLVPRLADGIAAAMVTVEAGDLIVVRENLAMRPLEKKIWERIESELVLCPLPAPTGIAAHRVAGETGCDGE